MQATNILPIIIGTASGKDVYKRQVHSVETVKVGAVIGSHIGTNACGIAVVKL